MSYDYIGKGKIKGRGNYTWETYPKKPYKIKLTEKNSILGETANKNWVLLADYCDKSLIRTAFMLEISKACGLKHSIIYHYVDLYLNEKYEGVYILTEQVERNEWCIDISKDGFIIEHDGYYKKEPLYFITSTKSYPYTFKYPDSDKDIKDGDDSFNFIKSFMNCFESVLYSDNFKDPTNGYCQYIDVNSFAKWYIKMELLANWDPNTFYVLSDRTSKLEMYPLWDAEWSIGNSDMENGGWIIGLGEPMPFNKIVHRDQRYFERLFQDENFRKIIKKEWSQAKNKIPLTLSNLRNLASSLEKAQQGNFSRWPILGSYVSVEIIKFDTWQEEVDYVFDFFEKRVRWFDSYVNNF